MAPEQWIDAALAGRDTDQYALALLAFEALAGERPFRGTNRRARRAALRASRCRRSPQISPRRSTRCSSRAAAKEPADRYRRPRPSSWTRCAQAAGSAAERRRAVAALPPSCAPQWITDAPQPIAEAIAALEAARTLASGRRAHDAIRPRVLARWLGALALACRSRIGPVDDRRDRSARCARSRAATLPRDDEWLDLAIALAARLADAPRAVADPRARCVVAPTRSRSPRCASSCALGSAIATPTSDRSRAAVDRALAGSRACSIGSPRCSTTRRRDVDGGSRAVDGPAAATSGVVPAARATARDTASCCSTPTARAVVAALAARPGRPADGRASPRSCSCSRDRSRADRRAASRCRAASSATTTWCGLARRAACSTRSSDGATRSTTSARRIPGLAAFTAQRSAHRSSAASARSRSSSTACARSRSSRSSDRRAPARARSSPPAWCPALPAGWRAITLRPGAHRSRRSPQRASASTASPYREHQRVDARDDLATACSSCFAAATRRHARAGRRSGRGAVHAVRTATRSASRSPRRSRTLRERPRGARRARAARRLPVPARGARGRGAACSARSVQILARARRATDLERIVTEPARRRGYDFDDPELPRDDRRRGRSIGRVRCRCSLSPRRELWELRDRHFQQLTRAAYERIGGVDRRARAARRRRRRSDARRRSHAGRASRFAACSPPKGRAAGARSRRARCRRSATTRPRPRDRAAARRAPARLARRRHRRADRDHPRGADAERGRGSAVASRGRRGCAAARAAARGGGALARPRPAAMACCGATTRSPSSALAVERGRPDRARDRVRRREPPGQPARQAAQARADYRRARRAVEHGRGARRRESSDREAARTGSPTRCRRFRGARSRGGGRGRPFKGAAVPGRGGEAGRPRSRARPPGQSRRAVAREPRANRDSRRRRDRACAVVGQDHTHDSTGRRLARGCGIV